MNTWKSYDESSGTNRRRIRTLRSSVRKMRHIGSTTNAHERLSAIPAPLATHTAHGAGAHSSPSAANQHAYVPKWSTKHATLASPHSATHHTFTSESCSRVPNFRSFDGGAAPSAGDPSPTNAGFSDAMRSAPLAPGFLRTTGSVAFGGARSRWPPAPMRTCRERRVVRRRVLCGRLAPGPRRVLCAPRAPRASR